MIDIHCHVLFAADDGAEDLDMSLEMCRIASADGIKTIVATPHYIVGEKNEKQIQEKVKLLNDALVKNSVDVKVFPGNEIFIDFNIAAKLSCGECFTLNDSRYVLVEFPMLEVPKYSTNALYELKLKGYVPIIAHPERNLYIQKNPELLYELVSSGCLAQVNSSSITGFSGKEAGKLSLKLISHNLVHFIASDAHSAGKRRPSLAASKKVLKDALGADKIDDLYYKNPEKIINNEDIQIFEPISIKNKRSLWEIVRFKQK